MTAWRQGTRVPHHVYEQHAEDPDPRAWPDGDRPVATFHDHRDARRAVEAVNGGLTPDSEQIRIERDEYREQLIRDNQRHGDVIAELRRCIAVLERRLSATDETGDGR